MHIKYIYIYVYIFIYTCMYVLLSAVAWKGSRVGWAGAEAWQRSSEFPVCQLRGSGSVYNALMCNRLGSNHRLRFKCLNWRTHVGPMASPKRWRRSCFRSWKTVEAVKRRGLFQAVGVKGQCRPFVSCIHACILAHQSITACAFWCYAVALLVYPSSHTFVKQEM